MLRRHGITLSMRPDITVGHKKHYTVGEYVSQRYLYARAYAGARFAQAGKAKRVLGGAAALALPPLLLGRILTRVMLKGQHRAELMKSLPSKELPLSQLSEPFQVTDAMVMTGLCTSKGEVRRKVAEGGVYVNDERWEQFDAGLTKDHLLHGSFLLLRLGKKRQAILRFLPDA